MSIQDRILEGKDKDRKHLYKKWRLTIREYKAIKHMIKVPISKNTLDKTEKTLEKLANTTSKSKKKPRCLEPSINDGLSSARCHFSAQIAEELTNSVACHDWSSARRLLRRLCSPGYRMYSSLIVRTCLILLFCHPNSDVKLLKQFVRDCTGYLLDEEINKFIRILFTLRESGLTPTACGKYTRKTNFYKIIQDPMFSAL